MLGCVTSKELVYLFSMLVCNFDDLVLSYVLNKICFTLRFIYLLVNLFILY